MRYGSVCSGIEAASVAWEPLGWTPAWFCEIAPFPSAVLAHRYPGVPNYGDFTALLDPTHPVHHDPAGPLDVLVGGTPCQDFSVAGLRAGIGGGRGSLTLDFCRLVGVLRPRWVVWENVPGVLSSDGGRALGAFLGALGELGYGFAWRVLDAQYFGLAQRRKRVFVVGCSGGLVGRAAAVLLELEGVRGNPPARRPARQEPPADAGGRAAAPGGGVAADSAEFLPFDTTQIISKTNRASPTFGDCCHPLTAGGHPPAIAFKASHYTREKDGAPSEVAPPLSADADRGDQDTLVFTGDGVVADPISANEGKTYTHEGDNNFRMHNCVGQPTPAMSVRRLTPRECERLQGFPDDWTLIPIGKGESSDSNRYRALGNSMAVPVMRWIGARIVRVDRASAPAPAAWLLNWSGRQEQD